jgi:aminoglycoside phosphotransferase (APT) family kinase protein
MTNADELMRDEYVQTLLSETVAAHVSPSARVVQGEAYPLQANMSGARMYRCDVLLDTAVGSPKTLSLVIKEAELVERRALAHLNQQGQPNVPYTHSLDLSTNGAMWMAMQYLEGQNRPSSLDPITEAALRAEAEALAAIHMASLGQGSELAWVPRLEPRFFTEVVSGWWRPHWERVLENSAFVREFADELPAVERAAESMPSEMMALVNEGASATLVHLDINPSNVLVCQGKPYYIDWMTAHYGPFYIDLPHHHCTLEQAEHYRVALRRYGVNISRADFADRYRVAAKYIALRYIWWTLENWENDPSETAWVRHYMGLISG